MQPALVLHQQVLFDPLFDPGRRGQGLGLALALAVGRVGSEEPQGDEVVEGGGPFDLRPALDQPVLELLREQVAQHAVRDRRVAVRPGGAPVHLGRVAGPGDGAGPDTRVAGARRGIEGVVDRAVPVLKGGELVEQLLGLDQVSGRGERRRGQGRVVGERKVQQPLVGGVVAGDVERADEPERGFAGAALFDDRRRRVVADGCRRPQADDALRPGRGLSARRPAGRGTCPSTGWACRPSPSARRRGPFRRGKVFERPRPEPWEGQGQASEPRRAAPNGRDGRQDWRRARLVLAGRGR